MKETCLCCATQKGKPNTSATHFLLGHSESEKVAREAVKKLTRDALLTLTFLQSELIADAIQSAYIRGAAEYACWRDKIAGKETP